MKKARENRNGKPMKQKPKLKEEKKKLNIKKRWDHLSSVNAKHWTSLLQNMLHFMAKKTGRFLHMKEMSLLSITIFFQLLVIRNFQRSIPDSSKDIIIGLGNALVDALAIIEDDNILTEMQLPKGSMTLIDEDKFLKISEYFSRMKTHLANGGSAGNAIRAMACLGAGTGFIGKVSNDFYGNFFRDSLLERGTEANLLLSTTLPSGVASTFISPDGERTFGTYLGAASTLKAEDLSLDMFKGYAYLFIEGYLVQDHDMILRAIELAKEAGLQVCLDMASYNIVEGDLEFFSLLVNKYVDIVFANEEEAKAFTGKEPEEALDIIAKMCSIAIVKVGARGSLIRKGTEMVQVQAAPVEKVVDTTGAGDYFAAGFLYGLTCGYSLEKCGKIGSLLSKDVIQVVGTELQAAQWEKIKEEILLIN